MAQSGDKSNGGYFRVLNSFVEEHLGGLSGSAIKVYLALLRHADKQGQCFPSEERLAELTRLSTRTVTRACRELESAGHLDTRRRQQATNLFTLSVPTPKDTESCSDTGVRIEESCSDTGVRSVRTPVSGLSGHQCPNYREGLPIEGKPIEGLPKKRAPSTDGKLTISQLVEKWNAIDGICHVRKITPDRRDAFRTRAKDAAWLADVPKALERIAKSSFLKGENKRNWKADLDWFLKPASQNKILEGKYDDGPNGTDPASGGQRSDGTMGTGSAARVRSGEYNAELFERSGCSANAAADAADHAGD